MAKGYYSIGLYGYEITPEKDDTCMVRWIGPKESPARRYRVQTSPGGRLFVRPNGLRIYLDQVLLTNI